MIKIKGTFFWPFLNHVDNFGKYSVMVVLDEAEAKKLKAYIKEKCVDKGRKPTIGETEDGKPCIRLRRKALNMEGEPIPAPKLVDKYNKPIPDSIRVGNESKGIVALDVGRYEYQGIKGYRLHWIGTMVTDLIEYQGLGDPFAEDAAGVEDQTDSSETSEDEEDPFR